MDLFEIAEGGTPPDYRAISTIQIQNTSDIFEGINQIPFSYEIQLLKKKL